MATTKKKTTKKEAVSATPVSLEGVMFNAAGKKAGTVALPASVFGLTWNADLVHQVVVSMQSNARGPVAHTKDRGEVRGGGKKPWKQKGTGRARHGSTRSPIWVGGGIAHGPRSDKSYEKKINRTARQKALLVALSRKWKDGEIVFLDRLEMDAPKTVAAKGILSALSGAGFPELVSKRKNAALVVLPRASRPVAKSFSNFGNIDTVDVRNLNPVAVLSAKYLVIAEPEAAFEVLESKKAAQSKTAKAKAA